jgi:hypothetical protein
MTANQNNRPIVVKEMKLSREMATEPKREREKKQTNKAMVENFADHSTT